MSEIDLDALEAKARAARPGPWQWYGNSKMRSVYLATVHGGRVFVMDFERWGMASAQPRFQIDHRMVRLGDLAKDESPLGPRFEVPYRRDFAGIGHPDAEHIAANSPDVTLALIARIRELEARRDIDSEIIDDLRLRHTQAVTARDAYAEQLLAATKHAVDLERQVAELKGKED